MTVKDLIQQLKKWNPDAEVRIGRYGGPIDCNIKGISVYILSPTKIQDYVYLGCEFTQYQGKKEQQTNSFVKNADCFGQISQLTGDVQKNIIMSN